MKYERNFTIDTDAAAQQVPVIRAPRPSALARWLGLGRQSRRSPAGWTPNPIYTWL
jgi:hypothetical protein